MVADRIQEVIFVGLPGPTHNYGGLSRDNVASSAHGGQASKPKEAARQVLGLVRLLGSLGIPTAILPPQLRPHLGLLATRFSGTPHEIIKQAAREDPKLLEVACSSSAMWVANAATVSPGIDCRDGKLHLTVANLHTNLHRRIEAADTYKALKAIFAKVPDAIVHPPLPAEKGFRDEGAANHTRLALKHGAKGLHIFAYGSGGGAGDPPTARQNLAASQEVARLHRLVPESTLFLKQNPNAIRHGVFHNDVIAVGNESFLLAHEAAYAEGEEDFELIDEAYQSFHDDAPVIGIVHEKSLSLQEAVETYFFNSQILTLKGGGMAIIAPAEVQNLFSGKAAKLMEKICADPGNPIRQVHYVDLRQSMHNGGGPACLRLRVPMTERQWDAMRVSVNVAGEEKLLFEIERIIEAHYPAELHPADLGNPELYDRCRQVLTEMGNLMRLPLAD